MSSRVTPPVPDLASLQALMMASGQQIPPGSTSVGQGPQISTRPQVLARPLPQQVAAWPPQAPAQSLQGSNPGLQGSGQGIPNFDQILRAVRASIQAHGSFQALQGSNQAFEGSNPALGTSNQALGASNQALRGSNQVLETSDQALRAADQGVGGSNQALGGFNQVSGGFNQVLRGSNQATQASDQASQASDHRIQLLDTASQAPNGESPSERYARGVAQMIQDGGQEIARLQAQLMGQHTGGTQAPTTPQLLNMPEVPEPMDITGSSPNSHDYSNGDTYSGPSMAGTIDVGSDSAEIPGASQRRPIDLTTSPIIPSNSHLGSVGNLNCTRGFNSTDTMTDWGLLQCSQQLLQNLGDNAAQGAALANLHPQLPSVTTTRLPPCPTGYDTDDDREEAPPKCIYQR